MKYGEENGHPGLIPGPHWDAETRELRINGRPVKRFKCKAANQETVLVRRQGLERGLAAGR